MVKLYLAQDNNNVGDLHKFLLNEDVLCILPVVS